MRTRLLIFTLALSAVAVLLLWVVPAVADQPKTTLSQAPAVVPEAATACQDSGRIADGTDGRIEICVISYCSSTPGKRCDWVSGGRCDQGQCHYHKVTGSCDPAVVPPSCAVGCN